MADSQSDLCSGFGYLLLAFGYSCTARGRQADTSWLHLSRKQDRHRRGRSITDAFRQPLQAAGPGTTWSIRVIAAINGRTPFPHFCSARIERVLLISELQCFSCRVESLLTGVSVLFVEFEGDLVVGDGVGGVFVLRVLAGEGLEDFVASCINARFAI